VSRLGVLLILLACDAGLEKELGELRQAYTITLTSRINA
jgi:hypothetical protein